MQKIFYHCSRNYQREWDIFSPLKTVAYTLVKILPFVSLRPTTQGLLKIVFCKTSLQLKSSNFISNQCHQCFNRVLVPLK